MTRITDVFMPRLNANDDSGLVTKWIKSQGAVVRSGELIASVETTKVSVDIEAPADGYLHILVEAGAMVPVGTVVAKVGPSADGIAANAPAPGEESPASGSERLVSKRARIALDTAGLSADRIPGSAPITAAEVIQFLATQAKGMVADSSLVDQLAPAANSVVLFGAAEQGCVIADCLWEGGQWIPLCFVDEAPQSDEHEGLPVFHADALAALRARDVRYIHICIADPQAKLRAAEVLKNIGFSIVPVIHPRAVVSRTARLGEGVYIGPGVVIGPRATIGDYCQINNNATIPHHVELGFGVRIADGVNLAGGVRVGDRSYLGLGVTVNSNCRIGADVTVVSGVAVFDSVADGTVVRARQFRS